MKRFRFRLDQVLHVRRLQEDIARAALHHGEPRRAPRRRRASNARLADYADRAPGPTARRPTTTSTGQCSSRQRRGRDHRRARGAYAHALGVVDERRAEWTDRPAAGRRAGTAGRTPPRRARDRSAPRRRPTRRRPRRRPPRPRSTRMTASSSRRIDRPHPAPSDTAPQRRAVERRRRAVRASTSLLAGRATRARARRREVTVTPVVARLDERRPATTANATATPTATRTDRPTTGPITRGHAGTLGRAPAIRRPTARRPDSDREAPTRREPTRPRLAAAARRARVPTATADASRRPPTPPRAGHAPATAARRPTRRDRDPTPTPLLAVAAESRGNRRAATPTPADRSPTRPTTDRVDPTLPPVATCRPRRPRTPTATDAQRRARSRRRSPRRRPRPPPAPRPHAATTARPAAAGPRPPTSGADDVRGRAAPRRAGRARTSTRRRRDRDRRRLRHPRRREQLVSVLTPLRDDADGTYNLRLELKPPELGRVEMRVEMRDGVLHASIHAEHAELGELLRAALGDLRDRLDADGVRTGELTVSDGSRRVAAQPGPRRREPPSPSRPSATDDERPDASPSPPPTPTLDSERLVARRSRI